MEPFKNLISPQLVGFIADQLAAVSTVDAANTFQRRVTAQLASLEMKDRVQLIADALLEQLPGNTRERHALLHGMLHPQVGIGISRSSDEQGIAGWGIWPLSLIVGQHGIDDFAGGLALLREMTQRSTAEFAIRYFLIADQKRALDIISTWIEDPNEDVRRLVSEGTRPRLPWGMRLHSLVRNPAPALPLLEALRDDPSDYVRRSVANHLNDVAKDHPELVIETAGRWLTDAGKERRKLVRHACRTLIKQGHAGAMNLFGFPPPLAMISPIELSAARVALGESLRFCIDITSSSQQAQSLSIDYVLHMLRANGSTSALVFKGGQATLEPGSTLQFCRTHTFRPVTTRRHYHGTHAVCLRINGIDTPSMAFELVVPD